MRLSGAASRLLLTGSQALPAPSRRVPAGSCSPSPHLRRATRASADLRGTVSGRHNSLSAENSRRGGGDSGGRTGGGGRAGSHGRAGGRGSRAGGPAASPEEKALNLKIRDAKNCDELASLLSSSEHLNAVNVSTAWVRLASLARADEQDRGRSSAGGAASAAAADSLEAVTVAAAPSMDVRALCTSLWGMTKVRVPAGNSRVSDRAQGTDPG